MFAVIKQYPQFQIDANILVEAPANDFKYPLF